MPLPETLLTARWTDLDLRVVSGTWPADVHGEMFISAPVVDPRLSFQLFGFGAMVRVSLTPGTFGAPSDRFALRTRTIDTPVQRIHERVPDAFRGGVLGLDSPFGHANMVNTAPLGWDGRLFATWDVGRPVEVDPVTLQFVAEVGAAHSWGGDSFGNRKNVLPQVFSTAHPVVDRERGCMWTVKLALGAGGLEPTIVRYDGTGTEVRTWPMPGAAVAGSMHTITQTANWLVLADSGNFKADFGEIMGGDRSVQIDTEVPVYFVRKDVVEATPPGEPVPYERATVGPTTGHYYADWDDSDGIRVLFEHMDLTDLACRLRADDVDAHGEALNPAYVGMYQMAMSAQTVSEVVFHPGRPTGERAASNRFDWTWNLQLSAMDWSQAGRMAPTLHHVVFQGRRPGAMAQRVLQLYRDRVDPAEVAGDEQHASLATFRRGDLALHARWEYPSSADFPSSPIFVPRPGGVPGGGDGWVVVPVISDDGFRVECFDAADIGRGPVGVLAGPNRERVPFMLHSIWMAAARPAPDVERLRFADDLDDEAVASLPDELGGVVREVAARLH
ncbi:MAG: carotenoid oxygenase family protein [Actinobacteria bacterium]|nr:carotenoid oxygenase family protein [Actinomycetota bacterium]